MLEQQVLSTYNHLLGSPTLTALSLALLDQQRRTWPQLFDGYTALGGIRTRKLHYGGYEVQLQFNPRRIVSTGAKVDPASIRERRCFLCVEHLPPDQKGVLYREEYLVLCNPAPIFDQHYTVSNVRHLPQSLEANIPIFLQLAVDFGPHFTVFYNGPRCGASAPDHLHFQACPTGTIPIENDIARDGHRRSVKSYGSTRLFEVQGIGRKVVLIESDDASRCGEALIALLSAMKKNAGTDEEPMINVIASQRDGLLRIVVFPRRKHRPAVYFQEGNARVVVSPAAVDMGGLVITPVETDFHHLDGAAVAAIYDEVSLDQPTFGAILDSL